MSSLWANGVRALRYRNYRLWFIGQLVSLTGNWMNSVASSWLVYRMTDSEFLLGLNFFFAHFPIFVLGPIAGVVVDRVNRRRLLLLVQCFSMLQSLILALLVLFGTPTITFILALSTLQGVLNAFDLPSRQALMAELVEKKEDLPNAIALNSVMFNLARMIGPSIGGLIVSLTNEGVVFLIDALSYGGAVIALSLISTTPPVISSSSLSIGGHIKEGITYVMRHALIRDILVLVFLVSLFGTQYLVLLSAMVKDIYHGGPLLLGILTTCSGVGALLSALLLAYLRDPAQLPLRVTVSGFLALGALILLSFLHSPWLAAPVIFVLGAGLISLFVSCNTIVQLQADDDKRGRVMSLYGMAMMGTMPLGALMAGALASVYGLEKTIFISGALGFASVLWYAWSRHESSRQSA